MTEYIDRDMALAFQNELEPCLCKDIMTQDLFSATKDSDLVAFLQSISAADVRPVVRGEWVRHFSRPGVYADLYWHCTACGYRSGERYANLYYSYCPHCGAVMSCVIRGDEDA